MKELKNKGRLDDSPGTKKAVERLSLDDGDSLDLKALENELDKENFRFMDAFAHHETQEVFGGV